MNTDPVLTTLDAFHSSAMDTPAIDGARVALSTQGVDAAGVLHLLTSVAAERDDVLAWQRIDSRLAELG
jgi:hypothetical protein